MEDKLQNNFPTRNYYDKSVSFVPGHARGKQERYCVLLPEQLYPPCLGAGLVHCLLLEVTPRPHVVEHANHFVQRLHPPSTAMRIQ